MKIYGFDENKNKCEVFGSSNFAILKNEYVLATNNQDEVVSHYLFFPDETWNVENTRILEARTTFYGKKSNGNLIRGMTELIGDNQIAWQNDISFVSPTEAKVTLTPDGKTKLGVDADIYYQHVLNGSIGSKEVFEVVIMKIDVEETQNG